MLYRCYNPNYPAFHRYGGRGISVVAEWHIFENFLNDMGPRPQDGYTLERRDNNSGYYKENCVWASWSDQFNNRSTTVKIEWNGKKQSKAQWSKELGLGKGCLDRRLSLGWSIEEALSTPSDNQGKVIRVHDVYTYKGQSKTLKQWSDEIKVPYETFASRIAKGWTIEDAIERPYKKKTLISWNGKHMTLAQICKQNGINVGSMKFRLKKGMSILDAIEDYREYKNKVIHNKNTPKVKKIREDLIYIEHDGERKNLTEWSAITGIKRQTLRKRLLDGLPSERVLFEPAKKGKTMKKYFYNEKYHTVKELSSIFGIGYTTARYRIEKGYTTIEDIFLKEGRHSGKIK